MGELVAIYFFITQPIYARLKTLNWRWFSGTQNFFDVYFPFPIFVGYSNLYFIWRYANHCSASSIFFSDTSVVNDD